LTARFDFYLALIHHPVYDKNGAVIASAVSNLDLHDISRAAKTYGVRAFYIVTPLEDQQKLVGRIVSHWTEGVGGDYNPDRRDALELIKVAASLEEVKQDIARNGKGVPAMVVTDAKPHARNIGYDTMRKMIDGEGSYLLLFGTAWGMTTEYIDQADHILAPIMGESGYNHLSVRSAAAIILDRLFGEDRLDT
jgi:hypothetical protein